MDGVSHVFDAHLNHIISHNLHCLDSPQTLDANLNSKHNSGSTSILWEISAATSIARLI